MVEEAIILAGGFGTRLREVVSDVPKPMAPVNDKPFLDYLLKYLAHSGIKKVVLSVGYLADKVKKYYGKNFEGITISYSVEKEPLGTGGGIRLAMEQCSTKEVLVLNGDSFFDIDLNNLYTSHTNNKSDFSLAIRQVSNASRYGAVELSIFQGGLKGISNASRISAFNEKSNFEKAGLINAGVYLLNRNLFLEHTSSAQNFSIEKDFFAAHLKSLTMHGFEMKGYFIDIGIPEDYKQAQNDFKTFKY
jgi:D-glycero-alpha-D-manno-heptose 1-phosphate guanylyltransferase